MGIQDYLDLFTGDKQNKPCRIVTPAGVVYEGVYLRSICPDKGLAIVIRPTGQTCKTLEHVTYAGNHTGEMSDEKAIPVDAIKEVAFDE